MKFYKIMPKSKESHSRRWFADEKGLSSLKDLYENYNRKNRWDEFEVIELTEQDKIWFDLGGSVMIDTPHIEKNLFGITWSILLTNVAILVEHFKTDEGVKPHRGNTRWMNTKYWSYCFDPSVFKKLAESYEEEIERCEKEEEELIRRLEEVNVQRI